MRKVLDLIEDEEQRITMARAFIKQDELDTIQLLSDLKYLSDKAFEDGVISPGELKSAIRQFRIECQMAFSTPAATTNFRQLWKKAAVVKGGQIGKLSQEELFLLKSLVGLEGELVFNQFPSQLDVCTRVAFYRFSVYGLSSQTPNSSRLSTQRKSFESMVIQLNYKGGLAQFLNILGSQDLLSEFCLSSQFVKKGFIGPIFFFKVKKAKEFNKLTGEKIRLTKSKDFLDNMPSEKLAKALTRLFKLDAKSIQKQVNSYTSISKENRFMLRVLQVKLWILGLYQGKLDHDFGPLSIEALKQLLSLVYPKKEKGDDDLKNILFVINSTQCAINFQYLLSNHIAELEAKGNALSLNNYYQLLEGKYEEHENAEVKEAAGNLSKEVQTSIISHANKLRGLKKPRKMYKGKSGFRKFISRIVKGIKSAISRIVNFIKKLVKLIAKTIKFVFEEIKEAFLTFKRGLSFLFGKRKVRISPTVLSDYDFDFDGYTVLLSSTNGNQLLVHTHEVKLRSEALYPSIRFVTEVIRWGSRLATPLGWVKVLIKMAGMLKDMILKRIRN